MRLYSFPPAPNPRKLQVYLGEKGIEIPMELVNLTKGEQRSPEHLARNPSGNLPVLELDDGTHLSESLAIIEYLEELNPEPPLIGGDPVERARVRRLERICELGVLGRIARLVHSTRSPLGTEPNPAVARQVRAELPGPLGVLDAEAADREFLAGNRPTIADCTLFGAWEFGAMFGITIDPCYANLHRWHDAFALRPSARLRME